MSIKDSCKGCVWFVEETYGGKTYYNCDMYPEDVYYYIEELPADCDMLIDYTRMVKNECEFN